MGNAARKGVAGCCVPSRDLPRSMALYRKGALPADKLMTGHLKLEEVNIGFDRLREAQAVRQVILLMWRAKSSPFAFAI